MQLGIADLFSYILIAVEEEMRAVGMRLDMPIQVSLRDRHNRSTAALRGVLGPSFDDAWQTGSALLPADVAALVSPLTVATMR